MGEDLKNKAFLYYISKGFSPEAAAGLVGTFISESQLIPTITNSSSGAYGLALWLGPRKRELFRRYGSNPTFENQLDYTWYELNNTHKNALKYLKNAKTPEEAANTVFGYYLFMTGPEGAIREMKKYGQNGKASLAQKVKYANNVYKSIVGDTTPLPLVKLLPISIASNSLAENMLPEVTVSGKRPTLTIPSSLYANKSNTSSTEDAMFSLAGLNPEDYAFKFTPPVMNIPHYADGKDVVEKRLPNITITPEPGSAERIMAAKLMIPNKDLRHRWYDYIMLYGDPAGQIERTYMAWRVAGEPGIKPYPKWTAKEDRSYYVNPPSNFLEKVGDVLGNVFGNIIPGYNFNTMYITDPSDLESELSHALQYNTKILPGEYTRGTHPEWNETKHYTTPGAQEYNAHNIIEPRLRGYTQGLINNERALRELKAWQNL